MPTKTDVLNYQPTHFLNTSEHLQNTGAAWDSASSQQHSEAMSLHWKGLGGEAYRAVATFDRATVQQASGQAMAAALLAVADSSLVTQAQITARYAIEDAEAASFDVGESFGLTDRLNTPPQARAARQAEAMYHSGQIGAAVNALWAADVKAARTMQAAGDFSFYHQPPNGHVQMVDQVTNSDGTVKNPTFAHDPNITDMHGGSAVDPNKHYCGPAEIGEETAIGTAGAYGASGAGGPGAIIPGIAGILKSFRDLSKCQSPTP